MRAGENAAGRGADASAKRQKRTLARFPKAGADVLKLGDALRP
jgi:hypothetical protein